jgi:peptide deformylase
MAILKIARMGHPVLRRRSDEVTDPGAPEFRRLIDDMIETLRDANGLGLAAPQVHVPVRLAIFHVPGERAEGEEQPLPLTVILNPEIEALNEDRDLGLEGCLSVPDLRGLVPRFTHIRYRGLDQEGAPIEREATGLHARVVQHEFDHLDGILFPMRMTDLSTLVYESELRHLLAEDEDEDEDEDEAEAEAEETEAEVA